MKDFKKKFSKENLKNIFVKMINSNSIYYVITIIVCIVIVICTLFKSGKSSDADIKINLLFDAYFNEVTEENVSDDISTFPIISFSDGKDKAIVMYSIKDTFTESKNTLIDNVLDYIEDKNYKTKYMKLDIASDIESIALSDLKLEIANEKNYSYNKGLILNDNLRSVVLLPAELDFNRIYDYKAEEGNVFSFTNLNTYLKYRKEEEFVYLPTMVKTFKTTGYFLDENNNVIKMADDEINYYNRKILDNKKENEEAIEKVTNYLYSKIKSNGTFNYYEDVTNGDAVYDTYNVLRHAGSAFVLMRNYDLINDKDKTKKTKLKKLLNFIDDQTLDNIGVTYVVSDDVINTGANALAALAYIDYCKNVEDTDVIRLKIIKLLDGITNQINEDGSLNHKLRTDFSVYKTFSSEYYDGEAIFALFKGYELLDEHMYLDKAFKLLDYYISSYGVTNSNHWIGYALDYATRYSDDVKYYDYLKDILDYKYKSYTKRNYTNYSSYEFLSNVDKVYDRMIEKNINSKLKSFDYDKYKNDMIRISNYYMGCIANPEISMYLSNQKDFSNAFFLRHKGLKVRVDEIQHSLMAMSNYQDYEY